MSLGEGGAASVGMRRLAQRAVSAVARHGRWPRPDRPVAPSRGRPHHRDDISRSSSRRLCATAASDDTRSVPGKLRAPFAPAGDQPTAIAQCIEHLSRDDDAKYTCLRGATGTGKTFVVANVIDTIARDKPTLVVVPNKTLAAQVARELRAYLRDTHRVELFVSHFSMYVPESFSRGRYVEKRSAIDPNLDALRHRATRALVESDNVVIVASVSCLYGMGMPADYVDARLSLEPDKSHVNGRDALGKRLTESLLYEQAGTSPGSGGIVDSVYADRVTQGQWAWGPVGVHGSDVRRLVVWPPYEDTPLQFDLDLEGRLLGFKRTDPGVNRDGAKRRAYVLEDVCDIAPLPPPCSATQGQGARVTLWPRQHHITPPDRLKAATAAINKELRERCAELRSQGMGVEAERLEQRTNADVALLNELGWCPGAEHYSRHLGGRKEGEPPVTLLDYLNFDSNAASGSTKKNRGWLLVADESHVMLPQLRAMHGGDRSRKLGLVAGGYRLPSALDNRPLAFDEFWQRVPRALLVSATPGDVENEWCADRMVDMVVRPSGVVDPPVKIFPRANQLPQLAAAVRERAQRGEATLVCALTKADCEDLAGYLNEIGGCRADWLHSELTAPQRAEKLQRLQGGEIDVLVGAQLLREGLDVPQVSLVAVLDAGVPGFMRSARSLMQMHGRAARNARGECHLFADGPPYTDAMNAAIDEINRRREKQRDFNTRNGITPTNAVAGSSSSSLSLFQVMAEEIAEERAAIEETSTARANTQAAAGTRYGPGGDGGGFAPSEEEVEAALKAWRLKRNGFSDAANAAAAARADANALKEARAETNAALAGPGGTWASLGDTFTESQFTDALFDPLNAPSVTGGKEKKVKAQSAEDVLGSLGVDTAHLASLRRQLADLPAKTGVYRWLAEDGSVLYIGKAKNLRDRTRGYLTPGLLRQSPRHRRLVSLARSVDTVLTPGGESDALALEARLINRTKPPLNVLLKEAPRPDAALIVGLMDPAGPKEVPRFFMTDAGDKAGVFADGKKIKISAGDAGANGDGAVRNRLGYDGIGGRVSPGVVKAAEAAAEAMKRTAGPAPGSFGAVAVSSGSSDLNRPAIRTWLRPTRADARSTLADLERALSLRSLAFRARHGDGDALLELKDAAGMAAAALDGGEAAEAAAAELERRGRHAAASTLRSASAPGAAALGALSSLLADDAAARGVGEEGMRVDVVAAAADGTHCRVQVVRIRDGTIEGMLTAAVDLPSTGRTHTRGDDGVLGSYEPVAEWLGPEDGETTSSVTEVRVDSTGAVTRGRVRLQDSGEVSLSVVDDTDADADADADDGELSLEVALGEAAQKALEAFYGDGSGGSAGDAPDAVLVPHALPDAPGLERIIQRSVQAGTSTRAKKGKKKTRMLRHGRDLPPGLPTALASLAKANAAESARRAAAQALAADAVAGILQLPAGTPVHSVEGVDISHLAGSATAASVVSFVDGVSDPAGHRRYELSVSESKGMTAPGDDPGAIYAAVTKRCMGKRGSTTLPDLLLIDGGSSQLVAAARALTDAGVVIANARAPDGTLIHLSEGDVRSEQTGSNAATPPRVALASLAKGRLSGEEAVYVPVVASLDDGTVSITPRKAWCSSAAKGKDVKGGPGLQLLRAVRDESHAVALGAHRRRRRSSLFQEMLQGDPSEFGLVEGVNAEVGDSSDEEEREMSAVG